MLGNRVEIHGCSIQILDESNFKSNPLERSRERFRCQCGGTLRCHIARRDALRVQKVATAIFRIFRNSGFGSPGLETVPPQTPCKTLPSHPPKNYTFTYQEEREERTLRGLGGGLPIDQDPGFRIPKSTMCKWTRPFWGQIAGGHPRASPRPRQPLFAVPALRELKSACRVSIL